MLVFGVLILWIPKHSATVNTTSLGSVCCISKDWSAVRDHQIVSSFHWSTDRLATYTVKYYKNMKYIIIHIWFCYIISSNNGLFRWWRLVVKYYQQASYVLYIIFVNMDMYIMYSYLHLQLYGIIHAYPFTTLECLLFLPQVCSH